MNLLALNHDVLSTIVFSLSTNDAFNLSATARAIHGLAMQRALSEVDLWCTEQMRGFCTFMLADVDGRLRWLRRLDISSETFNIEEDSPGELVLVDDGDISLCAAIADVLERAHNLQHLSLPFSGLLLQTEPRIGDAVATLRELTSLKLHYAGPGRTAIALVSRLSGSLRELDLSLLEEGAEDVHLFDLIAPLENLRSLNVSWLRPGNIQVPRDRGAGRRWPALHTLRIALSIIPLGEFADTFPNVQTLTLVNVGMADAGSGACWPCLDQVRATPRDPEGWRVACPVRWFQLEPHMLETNRATLGGIQSMSPVRLSFEIQDYMTDEFWVTLAQDASRLRYLDMMMRDPAIHTKLLSWMDRAPETLKPLNIVCLRLCLLDIPYGIMPNPGKLSDELIKRKFTSLFVNIPSVRYIAVGFGNRSLNHYVPMQCGTFDGEISWWRVTGAGIDRRADPLSPEDGRRLGEFVHSADFDAMDALDETVMHARRHVEYRPV
ncbi:hypothetical protein B0H21DRAFT_541310 [Amylocystis lapponica]|nr:hypothetical protein B0H21DRAFT_541310 [Amylocystis lapponica]